MIDARKPVIPSLGERRRATLIGLGAVLLWALLAPLSVLSGPVPSFLLTGLAFLVGGTVGLAIHLSRGGGLHALVAVPWPAAALGIGAFLGYHAVYFAALRMLPPVDALLVINTWPLLIVLLTALLPGERLAVRHIVGGLLGLAGASLIVLGGAAAAGERSLAGYLTAATAALIWSGYSVLNRRLAADVPTEAVTGFCLVTGALACLLHLLLERPGMPQGTGWLAVLALGLGPVGAAFYCWDHGTKRGDLRILGASAYAAPLIGAALLVAIGSAAFSLHLLAAAILIIAGAALASGDLLAKDDAA